MKYNNLGKSGLKVSFLSFGSWVTFGNQINTNLAKIMLKTAYEKGVNFFDNAEVYAYGESERIMGKALKELGFERDSYILSSKAYFGDKEQPAPTQKGLSRKHLIEACHAALSRLQTDYLDLYFCHRPDNDTPTEEIVFTMDSLIRQGKILYWGTSEWDAPRIMHAHLIAEKYNLHKPVTEQPQYNLLVRKKVEKEFAYLYDTVGLGLTTWSPLASGFLTGKYVDNPEAGGRLNLPRYEWLKEKLLGNDLQKKFEILKRFINLAENLNVTPAQLAIAWASSNPKVSTVILGASSPEQLEENLRVVQISDMMTEDLKNEIQSIFEPVSDLTC